MPISINRWVSAVSENIEDTTPAIPEPPMLVPTGPTRPQLSVPQPDHADRLPRQDVSGSAARYWWLGVHGGAGETSLAGLDKSTRAAGHHWPRSEAGTTVVLVARSNISGLRAAQRAATEWASGSLPGIRVAGLVIMSDAPGRIPKELRDFARIVGGGVPHIWNFPWIDGWRFGRDLALELLPKDARTVLEQVHIAATSTTSGLPVK
ncbi:DUF6668 family protein [Pseudarthrobacter sp. S9]|uniref:DUF6668 family protein n=1 Tax=Pseudarthrobacter sp. S9 TaxID=3418421 RepID=UPI003D07F7FA